MWYLGVRFLNVTIWTFGFLCWTWNIIRSCVKRFVKKNCPTWGRFQKTKSLAPEWWSCLLSSEASLKFTVIIFTRFWGRWNSQFPISYNSLWHTLNTRPQLSRYCAVRLIGAIPFMKGILANQKLSFLKSFLTEIIARYFAPRLCLVPYRLYQCNTHDEKTLIGWSSSSSKHENLGVATWMKF